MTCLSGLAILAPIPNGSPTPMVPNGPELRRWPGTKVGIDCRPKFRISCPSTTRMASRCIKFLISSHSRSGWIGTSSIGLLAPGAWRFATSPSDSVRRRGETICIDALGARIDELTEHRLAVADDADINPARRGRNLVGIDIDSRDLSAGIEAGRCRVTDNVVHAGADHDKQVGVAERR